MSETMAMLSITTRSLLLASVHFLQLFHFRFCASIDVVKANQPMTDGKTIISAGDSFELGFFSPNNSSNRYVGLWYKKVPEKIVWVANRASPLHDFSGVLAINDKGDLVLLDGKKNIIWSTNASVAPGNSSAKLLDTGNLVLRDGNSDANDGDILWQSFDHPTDSFLPTMKLHGNAKTNYSQTLKAWKSPSDPSVGTFFSRLDAQELPQLSVWNGSTRYWRSGPWNGQIFVGILVMHSFYLNGFNLIMDDEGAELSYTQFNASLIRFYILNSLGINQQLVWNEQKAELSVGWSAPDTICDFYNTCGHFGICNVRKTPICSCLRGFKPKDIEEWDNRNWSGGCVRRSDLKCQRNATKSGDGKEDWFFRLKKVKLPDYPQWLPAENAEQCKEKCFNNCSCVGYAYDNELSCMLWSGNLTDMQQFSIAGVDLYLRLADSQLDKNQDVKLIIIITVFSGILTIGICMYFFLGRIMKQRGVSNASSYTNVLRMAMKEQSKLDLPLFYFEELVTARNNFSAANKLGQGGFGSVYKGILEGKEIAIKRLCASSGQGLEEFKNEVLLISKLQHRNLVRLLGYCIEGEEKILVYEYMPNKSLAALLFQQTKQGLLDWTQRFLIVEGIARGLLYLHRDSRLRIIHRDLKASNILLDAKLNPKISDFGLARIFGGDQIQANTRRVVGTYGYMAPEYAMEGRFSEKSDVFSFGVLLLEIVTGKRNTRFYHHEFTQNLLSYAWQLWNEDKILQLLDTALGDSCCEAEVLRCIHIGLLCVQEFATDRPTMSSVVFMLGNEIASLPNPKQPAFTERRISEVANEMYSENDVTNTAIQAR